MSDEETTPEIEDSTEDSTEGGGDEPRREFVPPTDGSWVPVSRLTEVSRRAQDLERKVQELESKIGSNGTSAEKEYTELELRQAVDQGTISENEAAAILQKQAMEKLRKDIKAEVSAEIEQRRHSQELVTEINEYVRKIPNVMVDGTDERDRLLSQYKYLASKLGIQNENALQLAALRAAFGPVETYQARGKPVRETHQETGGGKADADPETKPGPLKDLSSDEKRYYEDLIRKGIYKSWDDVKEERKFKRKRA